MFTASILWLSLYFSMLTINYHIQEIQKGKSPLEDGVVWASSAATCLLWSLFYVYGSMSISHGSSDTAGGLATISEVDDSNSPLIFVSFSELPGHSYNYLNLKKRQAELAKEYKGKVAHPDPDIDTLDTGG